MNRKLRREVTTISRMTHKNIVRYYQAWVEGSGAEETINDEAEEEIENDDEDNNHDIAASLQQSLNDEDSESNTNGWWASPSGKPAKATNFWNGDTSSQQSSSASSSTSWSDEDEFQTSNGRSKSTNGFNGYMAELGDLNPLQVSSGVKHRNHSPIWVCTSFISQENLDRILFWQAWDFIVTFMTKR